MPVGLFLSTKNFLFYSNVKLLVGRMDVDQHGVVTEVHIAPCIDTDVQLMKLLTNLSTTLSNLVHFKLSRVKHKQQERFYA